MRSRTTARFRHAFAALPEHVQQHARAAYRLFRENPEHPGLRFKRIHATQPIYSVRVGLGYRAVCLREEDELIWFWIGTHADFDHLVTRL